MPTCSAAPTRQSRTAHSPARSPASVLSLLAIISVSGRSTAEGNKSVSQQPEGRGAAAVRPRAQQKRRAHQADAAQRSAVPSGLRGHGSHLWWVRAAGRAGGRGLSARAYRKGPLRCPLLLRHAARDLRGGRAAGRAPRRRLTSICGGKSVPQQPAGKRQRGRSLTPSAHRRSSGQRHGRRSQVTPCAAPRRSPLRGSPPDQTVNCGARHPPE